MAAAFRPSSRESRSRHCSLGNAAAALALLLLAASPAAAGDRPTLLTLPHVPRQGETVYLILTLGVLNGVREIDVETAGGTYIGLASPFAIPPGKPAGTYPIPVPPLAIEGTRLSVRFRVPLPGGDASRPATAGEIRKVAVEIRPPSRPDQNPP